VTEPSISTTSAALLGQLAWREQTPYEMTREVQRNVRYFWPRAAGHVYREVKRLTANGWATAERQRTGQRPRTVYRITEQGRRALEAWLDAPLAGEYLIATHPFQDQVHIRALTFDYLYNWARFMVAWAERTEREVRRWDDLAPTSEKHRRALDRLRAIIDREP
jgi:DNA-binding PadR family transcriptional regulator